MTEEELQAAMKENPRLTAEIALSWFPIANEISEIQYRREVDLRSIRMPRDNYTENVKHQAALLRRNAAMLISMVNEGDFDDASPGDKQDFIVDLVIAAEQAGAAQTELTEASNKVLERNQQS